MTREFSPQFMDLKMFKSTTTSPLCLIFALLMLFSFSGCGTVVSLIQENEAKKEREKAQIARAEQAEKDKIARAERAEENRIANEEREEQNRIANEERKKKQEVARIEREKQQRLTDAKNEYAFAFLRKHVYKKSCGSIKTKLESFIATEMGANLGYSKPKNIVLTSWNYKRGNVKTRHTMELTSKSKKRCAIEITLQTVNGSRNHNMRHYDIEEDFLKYMDTPRYERMLKDIEKITVPDAPVKNTDAN